MRVTVAVVAAMAWGCSNGSPTVSTTATPPPAFIATSVATVTPADHLEQLLSLMEIHAANAPRIDWPRARANVMAAAAEAQSIADTHSAIGLALNMLDDFESHYQGTDRRLIGPSPEPSCQPVTTDLPALPGTIGYVRLDACSCQGAAADRYAEELQQAIKTSDKPGLVGWIVDLREDRGGTCGR